MLDEQLLMADAEEIPADGALRRIAELADRQRALELAVTQAEVSLKTVQGELSEVRDKLLPEALASVGLSAFTLADGTRITVSDEYYANIPSADSDNPALAERRARVFAWLRDQGYGDLIKRKIEVLTGRGEDALADRVINGLRKADIPFSDTESIHPQTLKAFVKSCVESESQLSAEDIAAGKALPRELFGLHVKQVAKIGKGKRKNG